jgi:signal transduction histidine kinase
MSAWSVILISLFYLGLLFCLAYWADYRAKIGKSIVNNALVYSLSLGVFCTTWTYYGSVGQAANQGLIFLATYIGPALVLPLWWVIMRKIVRISKVKHLSTLADFISSRYGKSIFLGVLVTFICIVGIIPYISLQLKAISESFLLLTANDLQLETQLLFFEDTTFYLVLIIVFFNIIYGTRNIEANRVHEGMVAVIAFESVVKLLIFLMAGIFVTYFIFNGLGDVFSQSLANPTSRKLLIFNPETGLSDWFFLSLLSAFAFMFLPRQFQMAVIENMNEEHLKSATWLFSLYLWVINIFVLPIALAGLLIFANQTINPDHFVISIPLHFQQNWLALLVYLGGLSAGLSMITVALMALNTMISNNLVIPWFLSIPYFKAHFQDKLSQILIYTRRVSIFIIIFLAYIHFKLFAHKESLVSIGLLSFVAVAQFAPAVLGGIYWKRGNYYGALGGILLGFFLWFYLLVCPSLHNIGLLSADWLIKGPWGIELLKPYPFLGLKVLNPVAQGFFWTIFFNLGFYLVASILFKQSSIERNQAEIFVDIFEYDDTYEKAVIWKGTAEMKDLAELIENFLDKERAENLLDEFGEKIGLNWREIQMADYAWVNYTEKVLAGVIGAASARILIAANFHEEPITRRDVYEIFKESQELVRLNVELAQKTEELEAIGEELRQANDQLTKMDERKNEFISTVTHEMRTPITSIRAFSEILYDNEDLESDEKKQFLNTIIKETNRMERLINQVLELEKFESGKQQLNISALNINQLINESILSVKQLLQEKKINLKVNLAENLPEIKGDRDRVIQVLLNLLSNAIKFCNPQQPEIQIFSLTKEGYIEVSVWDNGKGIKKELFDLIFDKFYQAENQNIRKPKGSGLGLAICKKIIEYHQGKIWVESEENQYSRFTFVLPYFNGELAENFNMISE